MFRPCIAIGLALCVNALVANGQVGAQRGSSAKANNHIKTKYERPTNVTTVALAGESYAGQQTLPANFSSTPVNADLWRRDLKLLAEEMPRRHKNLFHRMTREQFEAAVKKLDERLPVLQRHQAIVELMRLVAMVGDGHTAVEGELGFRSYPIILYQFSDGLFVIAADRQHANLVGGRVIRIGNTPVEQAMKAVGELIPRDNDMGVMSLAPLFLSRAEVLQSLGLIADMEDAQFAVVRDGREISTGLKPMNDGPHALGFWFSDKPADWVDLRENTSTPTPPWLKDPKNNFWFDYLPDSRTIYVQFNAVNNKQNESVAEFSRRLFDFVDHHDVDRFVLDLRWNGGGDNTLSKPLLLGIIKANKIDQTGKLFTIIGRRTFSAAQNLVNDLENFTNTIFVGEPTAANVNSYGDPRAIVLPNLGVTVRVSSVWWQQMPERDHRRWTAPRLAAPLSSSDYRHNVDPAMKTILGYTPKNGLAEELIQAAQTRNISLITEIVKEIRNDPVAASRAVQDFARDPVNAYVDIEELLIRLGDFIGQGGFVKSAISVYEVDVAAFPDSARSYVSLGAAYARAGDKELAIKNYQQALKLDPNNQAAAEALKAFH